MTTNEEILKNNGECTCYKDDRYCNVCKRILFFMASARQDELGELLPKLENLQELQKTVEKEAEKAVAELQEKDKRVVVTSDHSELLGEGGEWFHPMWVKHPILNTVPYYEVKL